MSEIKRYRVWNNCAHDYGIIKANRAPENIRPGSFIILTEDDVAYIQSLAAPNKNPFNLGKLTIKDIAGEDVSEDFGVVKDEVNYLYDDTELEKRLKGTVASVKKWVAGITDNTLIARLYNMAIELDLAQSKIRAIEERLPSVAMIQE